MGQARDGELFCMLMNWPGSSQHDPRVNSMCLCHRSSRSKLGSSAGRKSSGPKAAGAGRQRKKVEPQVQEAAYQEQQQQNLKEYFSVVKVSMNAARVRVDHFVACERSAPWYITSFVLGCFGYLQDGMAPPAI